MQHFGKYELIHRIAVGGMGEVYLAQEQHTPEQKVAIKIIRSDLMYDVVARKRFQREFEVNSYLSHAHILPIIEFNEVDGRLYIVTPYIEGGTLSQRLEQGSLPLSELQTLFSSLVEAVAYLHKQGVIHRDLKPGNILLDTTTNQKEFSVRLIDFGIAIMLGQDLSLSMPSSLEHEMGTAAYMAPERQRGVINFGNDIYSLGIILHLMLSGHFPTDGEPDQTLPQPMIQLINRCIAEDPSRRFSSATELLTEFQRVCRTLTVTRMHSVIPQTNTARPAPSGNRNSSTNNAAADPLIEATSDQLSAPEMFKSKASAEQSAVRRPTRSSSAEYPPLRPSRSSSAEYPALHPSRSGSAEQPPLRSEKNGSAERMAVRPTPPKPRAQAPFPSQAQKTLNDEMLQDQPRNRGFKEKPISQELPASRPPVPARRSYRPGLTGSSSGQHPALRSQSSAMPSIPNTPAASSPIGAMKLPPLPGKEHLNARDFDAPTAHLQPQSQKKLASSVSQRDKVGQELPIARPVQRKAQRRKRSSFVIISAISLLLLCAIIGISYLVFQTSITARVTVGPKVQTVQGVFTMTAKPGIQNIDAGSSVIPATVLTDSKQNTQQGQTSGVTNCTFGIFQCKPAVTFADVSTIASGIRPGLQSQIAQDLKNQAASQGATMVGNIFYSDSNVSANPQVGSNSSTVSVTLTEQGSVETIKENDARTLAQQMLQKKLKKNYTLLSDQINVGTPVVRGVSANGTVTIAIAAAGIEQYQITQTELSAIQNQIKGLTPQQARSAIAKHTDLDQTDTSVQLSYGKTLPANTGQISIVTLNPTNIPQATLPKVPK